MKGRLQVANLLLRTGEEIEPMAESPPIPPTTGGAATPQAPTRAGYWLGAGIVTAGVLAAVVWAVLGIASFSREVDQFQRVPLGETGQVSFSAPGGYVIYYEGGPGSPGGVPDFNVSIRPLDGGEAGDLANYGGSLTYNLGGHAGSAAGTFQVRKPGRFTFQTTTSSQATGRLAVGRTIGRKLVGVVAGALALGFAGLLVGGAVVIVTAVKRRRVRRQTGTAP